MCVCRGREKGEGILVNLQYVALYHIIRAINRPISTGDGFLKCRLLRLIVCHFVKSIGSKSEAKGETSFLAK